MDYLKKVENQVEEVYFIQEFKRRYIEEYQKICLNSLKENNMDDDYDDLFPMNLSSQLIISIYDKLLEEMCINYLSLSKSQIKVLPANLIELINLILEDGMHVNPYRTSFLFSLQLVYAEYYSILNKGQPLIYISKSDENPTGLKITLNKYNKMEQFDFYNMDELERAKLATEVFEMESTNKRRQIPQVYIYKKTNY